MEKNNSTSTSNSDNQLSFTPAIYAEKIKTCYQTIEKNCFDIKSLTSLNKIYKALDEANIIQLDSKDSIDVVLNKFITKLIYVAYRHDEESDFYKDIRTYIDILKPELEHFSLDDLKKYIQKQEEDNSNYFGSYLSDDSDSEDLMDESDDVCAVNTLPVPIKKLEQFKDFLANNMTRLLNLKRDLKLQDITCLASFEERQHLHYEENSLEKARLQLDVLNKQLKEGQSINQIQARLKTRFFIAQYRGVTYFLDKWNQTTRKNHREIDETFECYYSEAVYHAAGYIPMNQFFKNKDRALKEQQTLYSKASILKGKLTSLQTTKASSSYKNKTYPNFKLLLQETYTNNYQEFKDLISSNKLLKKILVNGGNPFVSTADTPYHALRYAYGMKAYPRQKLLRLQPRWNDDGRAERPYIGKCYGFLIPLNDFNLLENPSHLVSQNWQGELSIPNHIVAERETSFDAFIDKDKIFLQHIAKYPSFNKSYSTSFLGKYGLDEPLYLLFQTAMKQTKPHTQARKNLKLLIGEWLCYVHELRLIKEAQTIANSRNAFLIYHSNEKNQFSFELPVDTPMRNSKKVTAEERQTVKDKRLLNTTNTVYNRPFYISNNNHLENTLYDQSHMSEMIGELSVETDSRSPYPQPNSLIENSSSYLSNTNQIIPSVTQKNSTQISIEKHALANVTENNITSAATSKNQSNKITASIEPILIEDEEEAYLFSIRNCHSEALNGNVSAQFELGKRYEYGHGLPKDEKQACGWYWKAAEQKHMPAIEYIQKKATAGSAWAEYLCGWLYEKGYGVLQNATKAVYWIKRAVDRHYPLAQFCMAQLYDAGNRVNKNEEEAINLCHQAAKQGCDQALQWLEKKAEQDAEALYALGILYFEGIGVPENKTKAFDYIQKAAKQNQPKAQYQLILCYENGYGVEKDEKQAVKYCTLLARQGYAMALEWLHKKAEEDENAHAQYWLGWLYADGKVVAKDLNKAFGLYERAAKKNNVYAQRFVAQCYQHGHGVEKNLELAAQWYQTASANGDKVAQEELAKITQTQTNYFNYS